MKTYNNNIKVYVNTIKKTNHLGSPSLSFITRAPNISTSIVDELDIGIRRKVRPVLRSSKSEDVSVVTTLSDAVMSRSEVNRL